MSVEGPSVDDLYDVIDEAVTSMDAARRVHALYAPVLERLAADIVKHREALDFIEGARSPDVATVARDRDIIAAALRGTRRDAARYREALETVRNVGDRAAVQVAAAALVEPKGQD